MYGFLAVAELETRRTNLAIGGCSFEALDGSGNRRIYIYLFFSMDKCLRFQSGNIQIKLHRNQKPTQNPPFGKPKPGARPAKWGKSRATEGRTSSRFRPWRGRTFWRSRLRSSRSSTGLASRLSPPSNPPCGLRAQGCAHTWSCQTLNDTKAPT